MKVHVIKFIQNSLKQPLRKVVIFIYIFDNFIEKEFLSHLAESEKKIIKRVRHRVEEEKN